MYKFTEEDIRNIIDENIHYFGITNSPEHVIVSEDYEINNGGYAQMIGPIDGEYGLAINVRDYTFDSKDAVVSLVLHELVHYKLLLEGKQSKDEIHDEEFLSLAKEIEEKTNIKGIISDGWISFMIRNKHKCFNLILLKQNDIWYISRLKSRKEMTYWDKYLREGVNVGDYQDYKVFSSRKEIYDGIPYTTSKTSINAIVIQKEDEYMFMP